MYSTFVEGLLVAYFDTKHQPVYWMNDNATCHVTDCHVIALCNILQSGPVTTKIMLGEVRYITVAVCSQCCIMELKFVEIVLVLDCILSNTAQTASSDYISCHAALNILALQLNVFLMQVII
jgi:hypothetical protein